MGKDAAYYRRLPYRRVVVPVDEADGEHYYLAYVRELPSIEIHGDTPEEALLRLDEIFDDCVEAMIDAGEDIPEPDLWPSGYSPEKLREAGPGSPGKSRKVEAPKEDEVAPWSKPAVEDQVTAGAAA